MNNIYEESEILLIAGIFKFPYRAFDAIKLIKPVMFSSRPHQNIFRVILNLAQKGIEPSIFLVRAELSQSNMLEESGGEEYITQLSLTESNISNIEEYCRIVESGFKQRELLKIGNEVVTSSLRTDNPDTVITRTIKNLDKLITDTNNDQIVFLGDILDKLFVVLKDRKENPDKIGIPTGFNIVDAVTTGYQPGELWLIGGRPSMGKTALLYSSFLNAAKLGNPVLLINREMNLLNILERMYSTTTGIPLINIRTGNLSPEQYQKLENARQELKKIPFYIDNSWNGDDTYVVSTIRRYHYMKGVKLVGLDYIQLLAERSMESTHELGRISRNLKLVAGELGISCIVLSQLNRDVEKREDKRPLMSDLRQSGNLEEDADYMIALYRDEVYTVNSRKAGIMEFIIRKARNGPCETFDLAFDPHTVTIRNIAEFDSARKARNVKQPK